MANPIIGPNKKNATIAATAIIMGRIINQFSRINKLIPCVTRRNRDAFTADIASIDRSELIDFCITLSISCNIWLRVGVRLGLKGDRTSAE